jgi:hypothetical protein
MLLDVSSWLEHPVLVWGLAGFSVLAVLASILLVPRYLASLPSDFLRTGEREAHTAMPLRILKNVLGILLVVLGVAMLILPGQGLLTLLVGVLLVDFPGKQKLVQRGLSRPKVLAVVNKLRAHRHAPPLVA